MTTEEAQYINLIRTELAFVLMELENGSKYKLDYEGLCDYLKRLHKDLDITNFKNYV